MTAQPLTPEQLACARIIQEWHDVYGHAPSYRELMRELDCRSVSSVVWRVRCLAERGWLLPAPPGSVRRLALVQRPRKIDEGAFEITAAGHAALQWRADQCTP